MLPEATLADADLDPLGRTDVLGTSFALQAELATIGTPGALLTECQPQTACVATAIARRDLARLRAMQQMAKTAKQASYCFVM